MASEVVILGAREHDLEQALAARRMCVRQAPVAELATLAHPGAAQPSAVVLDLRGAAALPPALTAFKRQHPATPVVMVASTIDAALILDAMRAGVNECLTEPITAAALEAAIRRLAARVPAARGKVFAFVGAKGGVGTTTTAVNVATVLSTAAPKETLLVDLHLSHGDASLLLGAEPKFSIVDALENTHRFDEAFFRGLVASTKPGPHLLASSDRAFVTPAGREQVRTVVQFASTLYRYTVLDMARTDPVALEALDDTSSIVIVANQELSAVRAGTRLAHALRDRYGKDRVTVIVNRYDRRAEIGQDDVERVVGGSLRHVVPSDYRRALQALNSGQPLTLSNHNPVSAALRDLAHDLAGLDDKSETSDRGSGIFGRLARR